MARIVLFHHAQGLRPDVEAWAESLRAGGHEVTAPDLYERATFDDLDSGVANMEEVGLPELIRRGSKALEEQPGDVVYAGFSIGAKLAQYFTSTRPQARAALLMYGGATNEPIDWPAGVPAQIHYMADDDWADAWAVAPFAATIEAAGGTLEAFSYPGEAHLFADPDGPDYDRGAADLMLKRELELLARLD